MLSVLHSFFFSFCLGPQGMGQYHSQVERASHLNFTWSRKPFTDVSKGVYVLGESRSCHVENQHQRIHRESQTWDKTLESNFLGPKVKD